MSKQADVLKEAFKAGQICAIDQYAGVYSVNFDEWYQNRINNDCPNCNAGSFNGKHCYDCVSDFNPMNIKDMVSNGMFNKGEVKPKPYHSIILYNTFDVQYRYSNKVAIGQHDGNNWNAYGAIVKQPDYWQYIDCD